MTRTVPHRMSPQAEQRVRARAREAARAMLASPKTSPAARERARRYL
ncbi:MAG: hypothetical protein ACRDPK_12585 [Carbonactinosporaceae bacterium]